MCFASILQPPVLRLAKDSFIHCFKIKGKLITFVYFYQKGVQSDHDLEGSRGAIKSINSIFVHSQLLAHLKVLFSTVNLCIQIKHATAAIDLH